MLILPTCFIDTVNTSTQFCTNSGQSRLWLQSVLRDVQTSCIVCGHLTDKGQVYFQFQGHFMPSLPCYSRQRQIGQQFYSHRSICRQFQFCRHTSDHNFQVYIHQHFFKIFERSNSESCVVPGYNHYIYRQIIPIYLL